MQETQQFTGAIAGRVEILRDRSGIPHIYAASTPDVYFGLGFAIAQDRLWQMDRLRRRWLGSPNAKPARWTRRRIAWSSR